jgi:hypothetical protein
MIDSAMALTRREIRIVQRLSRLFRAERSGRFGRWPVDAVRRLIERRDTLIEELLQLETKRRASASVTCQELDLAMVSFATEVERGDQRCREILAELGAELGRLRGEGTATGLRGGVAGHLLGRG